MELQGPVVQRHPVSIITPDFQISGQLETSGMMLGFLGDTSRESISLYDAQLAPLAVGSPLKPFSRPHLVLPRSQIALLYFQSAETRASISTMQRRELLVAYTPVVVCRGYFHMPAEAEVGDFLSVVTGGLLPVTSANIFPLVSLASQFPAEVDLVLIGRSQMRLYYPA